MKTLSLDGPWSFRFDGDDDWRELRVPGSWDLPEGPKDRSGPARYRRLFTVPEGWRGRRLWLRFDAVSYHCRMYLDGREVGGHTGLWDGFRVEISGWVEAGAEAELEVRVEKPAGLTAGPDSAPSGGRFPLRETLSGFLPYVWGHPFGGVWQSVTLEGTRGPALEELFASGAADGGYRLEGRLSEPASLELAIRDPDGRVLAEHRVDGETFALAGRLEGVSPWSPATPTCYRLEASRDGEPVAVRSFGFRSLGRDGTTLTLNGEPLYPRLALSWGWYPDLLHANPGRARARAEFERLRALGYNGVKLCLWVPPDDYFDVADEMGMLLWLELPMWLPRTTATFLEQTPGEIERIVRARRHHPAIVVYSLGCELNSEVGAELLERLYDSTKALVGDALLRDNSGSGEAYGGLLDEFADYYDYHFYSELPLFRNLLDLFTPRWRPEQPWLFGEFCDSDTFRDLRDLADPDGSLPWWARADPDVNPQGARWQYDLPFLEERLRANGFWERGAELRAVSEAQALLQRKFTLELVRAYREIGGYVITGMADTPISTAGMWDDDEAPKFEPAAFRAFNDDTVLLPGWGKRRAWIAGGDRAAYWDPYGYCSGDGVRLHLLLSHYGPEEGRARVRWRLTLPDGAVAAEGGAESEAVYRPATLREAGLAAFPAPPVQAPTKGMLEATATLGGRTVANAWPLWFFPRGAAEALDPIGLLDPAGVFAGIERLLPLAPAGEGAEVLLAGEWSTDLEARLRAGARAVVWLSGRQGEPLASLPLPFWREAVKVVEDHPAWGDFPHDGWTDLQFFGMTPERALDSRSLAAHRPLLRRLDARTAALHDYATEVPFGRGRALLTTLRFQGGLGEEPLGIGRNTCARELLVRWLRWLQAP